MATLFSSPLSTLWVQPPPAPTAPRPWALPPPPRVPFSQAPHAAPLLFPVVSPAPCLCLPCPHPFLVLHFPFVYSGAICSCYHRKGEARAPQNPLCSPNGEIAALPRFLPDNNGGSKQQDPKTQRQTQPLPSYQRAMWPVACCPGWRAPGAPRSLAKALEEQPGPQFLWLGLVTGTHLGALRQMAGQVGPDSLPWGVAVASSLPSSLTFSSMLGSPTLMATLRGRHHCTHVLYGET